jgi:putative transposase
MKHLGQLHSQYVNRNYGRTGSLWEGRFRSCLVQSENYVLACYRYIESNPVRAGLASHPGEYPWSSYRANANGVLSELVTPHGEYMRLGTTELARREAYQAMFGITLEPGRIEEIRAATHGNFVLGSKRFTRQVSATLGRRAERGHPGRPTRSPVDGNAQMELLATSEKTRSVPD